MPVKVRWLENFHGAAEIDLLLFLLRDQRKVVLKSMIGLFSSSGDRMCSSIGCIQGRGQCGN